MQPPDLAYKMSWLVSRASVEKPAQLSLDSQEDKQWVVCERVSTDIIGGRVRMLLAKVRLTYLSSLNAQDFSPVE